MRNGKFTVWDWQNVAFCGNVYNDLLVLPKQDVTCPLTYSLQATLVRHQAVPHHVQTTKKSEATRARTSDGKLKKNLGHAEMVGLIETWGSASHQASFEGMVYHSRMWASIFRICRTGCLVDAVHRPDSLLGSTTRSLKILLKASPKPLDFL